MLKKLLSAGVLLSLVVTVLVGAGAITASAQDLCATVDALAVAGIISADKVAAAKAAAGCGVATPAASYTFTRDLTVGATGADVTALQTMLGVNPATGYFGEITKAAVIAYQTSKGIAPAAGYVGPMTRASLNYVAPVVVVPTTPVTPASELEGTDGTISDVNELSTYNNEEVGEGESNVKVLGFEVEASNDGDIQIKSVKVSLTENGTGDSDNLDDYVDSVSIYMGSTKVGSADVDAFDEDTSGVFTKIVSLTDAIVKADETVKFYVAIDAVNTFDSGDIDGFDWSADIENIRYTDGSGVTTTETGYDIDGMDVAMDFVGFGDAADTEVKVTLASDSPDSSVVIIDDADTTEGVVLLKAKIKVDGDSDVVLDEMPITFTSVGGNVDELAGTVTLTIDGEDYSEAVSSDATTTSVVVFDNLGLDIAAGDTINITVTADVEGTDSSVMDNGDTLLASITADNMDNMDLENEEGDNVATGDTTGTATGEAMAFYDEGVVVTLYGTPTISKTTGVDNSSDVAVATIVVNVKAEGDTMYFAKVATSADGLPHVISGDDADVSVVSIATTADADEAGTGYVINNGETEKFTFTISMETTSLSLVNAEASITSLKWGSADGVYGNTYNFNMDDFKSPATTVKVQ